MDRRHCQLNIITVLIGSTVSDFERPWTHAMHY